jgi:acetyl esterase/lipase
VLFVVHGGFWKAAYDIEHIGHFSKKFSSYGIITCALEYRRVGNKGGGWPGTFLDASGAVDYFVELFKKDSRADIQRSAVIGHSAGGHLALWLGGRHKVPSDSELRLKESDWRPLASISLAGVSDLKLGWKQNLGSGAVEKLIGGSPDQYPRRYNIASPIELEPTGVKQILIHGKEDETVPVSQSTRFFELAKQQGDDPSLFSLDGVGHFDLIDPSSEAWQAVARPTLEVLGINADAVKRG